MKVVLLRDVKNLGQQGRIVDVKDGYAKNFLFARGLALPEGHEQAAAIAKEQFEQKQEAQKFESKTAVVAEKLRKTAIVFSRRATPEGTLYAGVHASEIAAKISSLFKIQLPAVNVLLDEQIKKIGQSKANIKIGNQLINIIIQVKT